MKYIISYKQRLREPNPKVYVRELKIEDLVTRCTEKKDCPQWLFAKKLTMGTNPADLGGFIIDWDNEEEPKLIDRFEYYLHQTHSGRWRIILPFDKYYKFTNAIDYKNAYEEMLEIMFSHYTQPLSELLEKKWIDKNFFSPNFFAIMRPIKYTLMHKEGDRYVPNFKSKNDEELKRDIVISGGERKVYEDVTECQAILARMKRFFAYYKCFMSWKWLTQKTLTSCIYGGEFHDKKEGDIYYNNPTANMVGYIKCMHNKCLDKLLERMAPFQNMKNLTSNYTVLHLAYGIISGKYSIAQIEACALHQYRGVLEHLNHLNYLNFNAKMDAPMWLMLLHSNILLDPETTYIYEFLDGYYVHLKPEVLKAKYQDSAGTYYAYRTSKEPKKYIDNMLEYAKGTMFRNFSNTIEIEGLSLKNGILSLTDDGTHEFAMASPAYFFTHRMDYIYDPNAKCELWKKILVDYFESLDCPQVQCLQEYAGYILMDSRKYHKLMVFFGAPRSGKNTLVQTLMELVPSISLHVSQLCNYKERENIIGKKVVFIDEFDVASRETTLSELKKIAASTTISVRPMREKEIQVSKVPKLLISFNKPPTNFRIDTAFGERMLAIRFVRSFKDNPDYNLLNKLREERSGILNWALEGYERLTKNDEFTKWSEDTTSLYEAISDEGDYQLEEFLKEKFKEKRTWGATELHLAYNSSNMGGELTLSSFCRKLSFASGVNKKRTSTGVVYTNAGY